MNERIYLSPPHMSGHELDLLQEAYASNWIAPLGPFVERFEQDLGHYLGGLHVCALSSGTAALHLSLILAGVKSGDRVYCSDFTFSATANAIRYCQAQPVFIDSDWRSWQMDPALLEEKLESDARRGCLPKAVMVVDLYGTPADYDRIEPLCQRYGVTLLCDSAEALGSSLGERKCGSFGQSAVLSFNGNKIITTSGGGALVSSDPKLIAKARYLATQAREARPYYHHIEIGYNYRLSNLLAAVGCGQLKVLDERVAARRQIFKRYQEAFRPLEGLRWLPQPKGSRPNAWLSVVCFDPRHFRVDIEGLRKALESDEIEARHAWKPMHQQPIFQDFECVGGSVSNEIFDHALCLPSGSAMTEAQQERVIQSLKRALKL